MKTTNKFKLTYFEQDDFTLAIPEIQRWNTLDVQLNSLFRVLGNGVLDGWNLSASDQGLSVSISPGSGHVNFVAVESASDFTIDGLLPNSENYIYANLQDDSYWTKNVVFDARLDKVDLENALYVGKVTTDADSVFAIDVDDREVLGFEALIKQVVSEHRHLGGTNNPSRIDLSSEVTGVLNQENLPDIDASLIKSGVLSSSTIPKIDHIEGLINQGELTHSQIDSFISQLSFEDNSLMGEVSTANLLQLTLALKHVYPDIDEYMVNQISFIPGISPDEYIDFENTTATVDTRTAQQGGQHTITGTEVGSFELKSRLWNSKKDFELAELDFAIIDGDRIVVDTENESFLLEDFENIGDWSILIEDLSDLNAEITSDSTKTIPNSLSSGKINLNGEQINFNLLTQKTFNFQNWSNYNFLRFFIYTDSIEHGDIFFFLQDAVGGIQNSTTKVLSRNVATIDKDTLGVGWQEVLIDLTPYSRNAINRIGFYLSTQEGWDSSKPFEFNIDDIELNSGNKYFNSGSANFIYSSDFKLEYTDIKWEGNILSDSQSSGNLIQTRYRLANDEASLSFAEWSDFVVDKNYEISETTKYKFIEIQVLLSASDDFTRTPFLTSLEVGFKVLGNQLSFVYDDQSDWGKGTLFNLDENSDSLKVKNLENLNSYLVGGENSISRLDSSFSESYRQLGLLIPRNTNEVIEKKAAGLGFVTAVQEVEGNKFWVSDLENNKVVQIDNYGNFYKGIYGSFLKTPVDNYGNEDKGAGSDVIDEATLYTPELKPSDVKALHAIYNANLGRLYVVFDQDLENIYSPTSLLNLDKFYLTINSHIFRLNDADVKLLGVDEEKYNLWNSFYDTPLQIGSTVLNNIYQFKFNSHILEFNLKGADKTALNRFVNNKVPKVYIISPKQNEILKSFELKIGYSNWEISNGYNLFIDGMNRGTYYQDSVSLNLTDGKHGIKIELLNSEGNLEGNIESIVESECWVENQTNSQPHLTINSPLPNQITSSSTVYVDFKLDNLPILSNGQHLQYKLNDNSYEDYHSTDPILLSNLQNGQNSVSFRTVDEFNVPLNYERTEISTSFIYGNNSSAYVQLKLDENAIFNADLTQSNGISSLTVDVGDIVFQNLYAPVDLKILDRNIVEGEPDLLIGKMRSYSWLSGLGSSENIEEILLRVAAQAEGTQDIEFNSKFEDVDDRRLIYGNPYLNGHSVVQFSSDGELVSSNNAAVFSDSKEKLKDSLGSVNLIDSNEWMIADSINKRAIIVNPTTKNVDWQYDSDRFVVDFQPSQNITNDIFVYDDKISETNLFIKEGSTVIWHNESSQPITIYSGNTTFDDFQITPDLNLYGNDFKSKTLNPGEQYSFSFNDLGEFSWFVYPDILVGTINVTKFRILNSDKYYLLESDGLNSPFSSRVIKINSSGNVEWTFGEGYMVKPRDVRPLRNNKLLIST